MRSRWTALLFSPVGLLLLSAARLIIISDFNTTTATTVASSGGYVNTLLGPVIPLLPVFVPYVALLLLLARHFVLSIVAFVFTVFITPTSLRLPVTLRLARLDEHQLLIWVSADPFFTIVIALLIGFTVWIFSGSLVEALGILVVAVVTLALLLIAPKSPQSLPSALGFVGAAEQKIALFIINERILTAIALVFIFIIALGSATFLGMARALTTLIALMATLALFPYVSNFYPAPRHSSYYVDVLRTPWLPAEKIKLSSGVVYNGYVLSADAGWFIVLLTNSRRVVYLPALDVARRTVCQPVTPSQPPPRKPLIPLFYTRPPVIPRCPSRDSYATRTSILSTGQSLNFISSQVHVPPGQIICVTNAYQHHRLSVALHAYETVRDWNKPTPVGQHFWYYPPIAP